MASWHYIQHGTMSNGMIFTRVTKLYPSYDGGLNKGDIHQFLIGMKAHDSCYSFFIPSQDCVPSPTREHETEVCLVCPINETETEINKITFICVLKRSRCSDVSSPVCWEGGFYCARVGLVSVSFLLDLNNVSLRHRYGYNRICFDFRTESVTPGTFVLSFSFDKFVWQSVFKST